MDNQLRGKLEALFGNDSADLEHLIRLYDNLIENDVFTVQNSAYPANHGEPHIRKVMDNLFRLVGAFPKTESAHQSPFGPNGLVKLFAAAMIHDVGMIHLHNTGTDSDAALSARKCHAQFAVIERIAEEYLNRARFDPAGIDDILLIASAHAGDGTRTAPEKIELVRDRHQTYVLLAHLLRLADFIDLGEGRLIKPVSEIRWNEAQEYHVEKHMVMAVAEGWKDVIKIDLRHALHEEWDGTRKKLEERENSKETSAALDQAWRNKLAQPLETMATLRQVYEDARKHVARLNDVAGVWGVRWDVARLDEEFFGTIWPQSKGVQLFASEMQTALSQSWADQEMPFRIDMMGHSLYQRFKQNKEKLNAILQDKLEAGEVALRVLLLDPNVENQQMREVYDAQASSAADSESSSTETRDDSRGRYEEAGRSILARYDTEGVIDTSEAGDIRAVIDEIKDGWTGKVKGKSVLELRATTRIMYANITRFGKRMLVSPYRDGGLFNQTGTVVLSSRSPLFWAYASEFEGIWNTEETRMCCHTTVLPRECANPIKRRVKGSAQTSVRIPSFDYERWILGNKRVIKAWFENKRVVPPLEVEFQPSAKCDLHCYNCIGQHLGRVDAERSTGSYGLTKLEDIGELQSVFDWQETLDGSEDPFRVERIRISGLLGDPLHESSQDFTLALIGKAKDLDREVIVFTNGFTLDDKDVRWELLKADCVHISLDAATRESFNKIKNPDDHDLFDKIRDNLAKLCRENPNADGSTKIGIGYVVTQENSSRKEIQDVIAWAVGLKLSFIRFKRDIRSPKAIGWRNWDDVRRQIDKSRPNSFAEGLALYITDVPRGQEGLPPGEPCWAQRYCVAVGPDGHIYPCDHLTGAGKKVGWGDLNTLSLEEIVTNGLPKQQEGKPTRVEPRTGKSCRHCAQCPPFSAHMNPLLDELFALFTNYDWDQVDGWIEDALSAPDAVREVRDAWGPRRLGSERI